MLAETYKQTQYCFYRQCSRGIKTKAYLAAFCKLIGLSTFATPLSSGKMTNFPSSTPALTRSCFVLNFALPHVTFILKHFEPRLFLGVVKFFSEQVTFLEHLDFIWLNAKVVKFILDPFFAQEAIICSLQETL